MQHPNQSGDRNCRGCAKCRNIGRLRRTFAAGAPACRGRGAARATLARVSDGDAAGATVTRLPRCGPRL